MAVGTWKLSQCMTQNTLRVGLRAVFFFSYGTNLTKEQSLCISSFREQTPNGSNLTRQSHQGQTNGTKSLVFPVSKLANDLKEKFTKSRMFPAVHTPCLGTSQ